MKTKVNFQSLEFDVGNVEADLVISMASVQEVNVGFMNSLYGYFIGKRIAYSLVEQYAWNKWCLWVKLHNVPMVSFTSDTLSMIATKLSNPITLDSYMSSMCMEYFARGNFAHALIDLEATCGLKDKLVVAIPKLEDSGYSMETIRPSTNNTKPKDGKQKDIQDDGFHSVKRKTSKDGNWDRQDNGKPMYDLVDDTRKKVEAPPRKTGI
ncbi:hypothetical protein Tco_0975047 [Tanacetum coccineum]|uniref:Uncharacterized protein n=1 Tax=Tanacetum coccineum TaxID=301880 RepID=A0ABQ5ED92_9ASTR